MLRHEQPGLGHLIRALALKVSEMQREISGLRQDVRTLSHLVRGLSEREPDTIIPEPETPTETDPLAE